jgi:hypothetical protein
LPVQRAKLVKQRQKTKKSLSPFRLQHHKSSEKNS